MTIFHLIFQVFPLEHLQIFTEEELERLLCGERDFLAVRSYCLIDLVMGNADLSLLISDLVLKQFNEVLDHIKFDHGYTASSPPVVNVSDTLYFCFWCFCYKFHLN